MSTPLLALFLSLAPAVAGAEAPDEAPRPLAGSRAGAPPAASPVGGTPASSAPADSSSWTPPDGVVGRLREEIGRRWGVAAERVRLEWGPVRAEWREVEVADFRLMGSGDGGSWVVSFLDADGRRRFGVRLTAGVRVRRPVAARRLERGDTLRAKDVRREAGVVRGRPTARDSVRPGWIARRPVQPGEVLRPPAVTRPAAVESGRTVDVLLRRGSVQLTVPGRASGTAARGESVRVRLETGRRVRGVAVAENVVRIERRGGGSR